MVAKKRKKYTDKFKAGAITLLQSEGYPDDPYALKKVAKKIGVPDRTLRRWHNGENGHPPDDIVRETKKELIDLFDDEIRDVMKELPSARPEAPYKDLVMGVAILVDKKQLLGGQPTDRTDNTHTLKWPAPPRLDDGD